MNASEFPRLSSLKHAALWKALHHLPVAVLGLGASGLAASRLLLRAKSVLFVSESDPRKTFQDFPEFLQKAHRRGQMRFEIGGHSKRLLEQALLVVSPGVQWELPILRQARGQGVVVWSEMELGYRLAQVKKIAAVTGTNGKTTTTSLLGEMARRSGRSTWVGGNLGKPLCDFAFANRRSQYAVLEVSSYQLEGIDSFHADAATVLNLTNDHLHRHKTMARYAAVKARVFENQNGANLSALNAEDVWCRKMARKAPGKVIWFSTKRMLRSGIFYDRQRDQIAARFNSRTRYFPLPAHLPGLHNIENACAAIACAFGLQIPAAAVQSALLHFRAVEHRLEPVAKIRSVEFVNDSKGTNVDSTVKAILAFKKPLWLILGGQDKGGSYAPIRRLIERSRRETNPAWGPVKGVYLIGEAAPIIEKALQGSCPIERCGTLENAVRKSYNQAQGGDLVLLSPACASFDQFKNFEDRGKQFKRFVGDLSG